MRRVYRYWPAVAIAALSTFLVLLAQGTYIASGVFNSATPMAVARDGASSAVLLDGRILVTGGKDDSGNPLDAAEILGGSGAGQMHAPRAGHISVTLNDGTVLVAGGSTTGDAATNSTEVYNPSAGAWTVAEHSMLEARIGATATLLSDGRVLIAGGDNGNGPLQTTEIYDPASGVFSTGPPLSRARKNHAATLLNDGRVAIAGGMGVDSDGQTPLPLNTVDIYDPVANTATPFAATMSAPRIGLSATTLLKGQVLLAGGGAASGAASATTDILDATSGTVIPGPSMSLARAGHLALLLPNNNTVLMVGGASDSPAAEIYVPWQNVFTPFGTLAAARTDATGGASGQMGAAFIAGGQVSGAASSVVEIIHFPMVKTDKPDYHPGDTATITGSGFVPGEAVNLSIEEIPDLDADSPIQLQAAADALGNVSTTLPIDAADANIRFYLTAMGATSGLTAGMTFTDANNVILGVAFSGSGSGSVTSSSPGTINCTSTGGVASDTCTDSTHLANNSVVTLTATASGGSTIGNWTMPAVNPPYSINSGCTSGSTTCTFTMSSKDGTVTVAFNAPVKTNPSFSGLSSPTITYGTASTTLSGTVVGTGSNAPSGNVTVTLNGVPRNAPLSPSGANAATFSSSFATGSLTVASSPYTIAYHYGGDANYNAISPDGSGTLTVTKAATTTAVTSSVNPSVIGQSVTFTATVSVTAPGAGTPTGNVTFTIDGVAQSPSALSGTTATISTSALTAGGSPHTILAHYNGDGNFNASADGSLSGGQVVNKADTTTSITNAASLASAATVVGQAYTVNWSVTVSLPGVGTPTGTVIVSDGSQTCSASVAAGSCSLTSTTAGAKTITASYGGDTNFNTSASSGAAHTVNQAATATGVTSSVNPSVFGQSVTFTATVSVTAPGAGTPTGSVTFSIDGTAQAPSALSGTTATISTTAFTVSGSPHTVSAAYNGDANFLTSSGSLSGGQTVNKSNTSSTVGVISPEPSVVGQAYTVNVIVAAVAPGAGTPTGTVTIGDGATTCSATLSGGAGNCMLTSTTAGTKTISAGYNGDGSFKTSSTTGSHVVNPSPTSTSSTSGLTPATVVGQAYTIGVMVASVAPGSGMPTGTVSVDDGTGATCTATLASGSGSCSLTSTTAGAKTITAKYNSDGNYATSSTTGSHTVNQAATATGVTSSVNPSVFGQSVTFTATVSVTAPGAGTPTGSVTFSIDGTAQAPSALSGTTATISITALTVSGSPHTVSATYNGDTNFLTSSGSLSGGQVVNKAATKTTLGIISPEPSVVGQAYTVNVSVAAVAPGAGTPTGTVTIGDGATTCSATLSGGAGSCMLTSTTAGTKTISAGYNGDGNFNTSSTTGSHVVNKADTTTSITNAASLASTATVVGQAYTVNWSVTVSLPGIGTPTGTVTVSDGSQTCSASVAAGSCSLTSTTAGAKTITASYGGDTNFNTSASSGAAHTVNQAATATGVTSSVNPSVFGQSVTFTATVSVTAPGAGTPTGSVTFTIDGMAQAPSALSGNTATFTTAALSAATHTVSATYSGDANFLTSSGNLASGQVVNKAATSMAVVSSLNPSVFGQSVMFTAMVSVTAPGAGTPTGNVTFSIDGVAQAPSSLSGNAATFTTNALTAGIHRVLAVYSGDGSFLTSGGGLSGGQVVNKAPTLVTSVMVTPASQQYSDLVNLSATVSSAPPIGGSLSFYINYGAGTQQLLGTVSVAASSSAGVTGVALLETVAGSMNPLVAHTVTAVFTPVDLIDFTGSSNSTPLAITPEDARVDYTGQTFVATVNSSVSVPLTFTIRDSNALLPADGTDYTTHFDAYPGDIRNALVTINVNGAAVCSNQTPVLINAADSRTGTVGCVANLAVNAVPYNITVDVSNYYQATAESDTTETVVVSQASGTGFITGGGYTINGTAPNPTSLGTYKGDAGRKTNYGFNVQYNKKGTNLQGNANIIIRGGGHSYQIKANSMQSLVVNDTTVGGTATFVSKANLTDVTNPDNPIMLGGNYSLTLSLADNGQPGTSDTIGIQLFNGSTLLFSNNWNGVQTVNKLIDGGNLMVH